MRLSGLIFGTLPCLTYAYDYVIVGGGTCGLLLANRLSQEPSVTVAIIDPGADERNNPLVKRPAGSIDLFRSLLTNWNYTTVPQSGASNRVLDIHSGKGLGGSSLINGMAYVRGDKAQFDAWEELGNTGWNWENLLPYFKKVEKMFPPAIWQTELGATIGRDNHGFDGDMHVGFLISPQNRTFYGSVQQSWAKLGYNFNSDVNNGTTHGFGICPQTVDPELSRRWDAATAFLRPIAGRPNLHILNGTATRIIWQDDEDMGNDTFPQASGVEYVTPDQQVRTAHASREVVLSAGTFRTPLILERSGIGNPRLLRDMGINPIVDLAGVGENLVDQPNTPIMFNVGNGLHGGSPYVSFATASDLFGSNVSAMAAYTRQNLGRWAREAAKSNPGSLGRAEAFERIFRVQYDLIFNKSVTLSEVFTTAFAGKIVSTPAYLLPFSRGSIHRTSGHDSPTSPDIPVIDPKYLNVDFDMTAQVAAGRLAVRLSTVSPLKDLARGGLLAPDEDERSTPPPSMDADDDQWRKWTADAMSSNWHSMGTTAMMSRELDGVLDPRLKVYNTRRLRVVDASMLPMPFSGHPMAILYAVTERAADMIKQDAGLASSSGAAQIVLGHAFSA